MLILLKNVLLMFLVIFGNNNFSILQGWTIVIQQKMLNYYLTYKKLNN
jgi:hypothetical protein